MIISPLKDIAINDIKKLDDLRCIEIKSYFLELSKIFIKAEFDDKHLIHQLKKINDAIDKMKIHNDENQYILRDFNEFMIHIENSVVMKNFSLESKQQHVIRIVSYFLDVCENIAQINDKSIRIYSGSQSNWIFTNEVVNSRHYQQMIYFLHLIFCHVFVYNRNNS